MFINGKHISTYYSEIKKLESIVFNYDLEVLEGLLKYIRAFREKTKKFCIILAISNPPLSEENKGYPYPEGIEPVDYWMQNQSFAFEEYDYYEALISKVFDAKIPIFMKPEEEYQEVKTREKPETETHYMPLFKSSLKDPTIFLEFYELLVNVWGEKCTNKAQRISLLQHVRQHYFNHLTEHKFGLIYEELFNEKIGYERKINEIYEKHKEKFVDFPKMKDILKSLK